MTIHSSTYQSLSDNELLSEYKDSENPDYIGELFKRYTHLVFGVCMKYFKNEEDSRDAVMQIFEKLLTDLKIHEISNFKSWLYSVAKNHCLMGLRKNKVQSRAETGLQKEIELDVVEFQQYPHLNNEEIDKDKFKSLQDGIDLLNTEQKICVELFYLKEKSYDEVAKETGYSMKQVKSYLQNGKRNLNNYLSKKNV